MSENHIPCLTATAVLPLDPDVICLVDVRKLPAARASGRMLAGARWVDPFSLGFGHPVLGDPRRLVFHCVHGHEVSQFAAALATVAGRDAAYVAGGFEALCAAGAACAPFAVDTGE